MSLSVKRPPTSSDLRQFNLIAGSLLVLQAILIAVLGRSAAASTPIYGMYLTNDGMATALAGANSRPVQTVALARIFDLKYVFMVVAFLLVAAAVHFLAATVWRNRYERLLERNISPYRWLGVSVICGLLMMILATQVGIRDIGGLLMVGCLSSIGGLLGGVTELLRAEGGSKKVILKYPAWKIVGLLGAKAAVIPWVVFGLAILSARFHGNGIRGFAYWLLLSVLVLMAAAGANIYMQYQRRGLWADYKYAEMVAIVIGLLIASASAWQLYFGLLA